MCSHLPLYTNFMGSTASAVATISSALCLRPLTTIRPSIFPDTNTSPPGPMKPSSPVRVKGYSLIGAPELLMGKTWQPTKQKTTIKIKLYICKFNTAYKCGSSLYGYGVEVCTTMGSDTTVWRRTSVECAECGYLREDTDMCAGKKWLVGSHKM